MSIDSQCQIGNLAAEYPLATRIFSRYHIDYCCGGGRVLSEVCMEKGLDPEQVVREIRCEVEKNHIPSQRWDQAPLDELIEHILVTNHRPLDAELPRLEALAVKVNEVHGEKAPGVLPKLLTTLSAFRQELEQHMMKEERILFPMILSEGGPYPQGPITVMRQEHDDAGEMLKELRALTQGYRVPDDACNSWRALWTGLEALEFEIEQHIHLENNVLFPRALGIN